MLFYCTAYLKIGSSRITGNLATINAAILSSPKFNAIFSRFVLKVVASSDLKMAFILFTSFMDLINNEVLIYYLKYLLGG